MNDNYKDYSFTVATVKNPTDGEPKVEAFTIETFKAKVCKAPKSQTLYEAYHFQKSEEKRISILSQAAKLDGNMPLAKALKEEAKEYKLAQQRTKFGPGIMPYVYKNNQTYKEITPGFKQRVKDHITHFSLILLDIESSTSKEEIHEVLADYEYMLWTTITHRPEDLRYRVVLFPETPIKSEVAQALISRIDANLPNRNHISKKTQCIDPASMEIGRLMFLPRWLTNHPLKYEFVHNQGKLLQADDFTISEEQQAVIVQRLQGSEKAKKEKSDNSIKRAISTGTNELIIPKSDKKAGENDWLSPKAEFETDDGWVTLSDVTGKISNVLCPFHGDIRGSEFISINNKSGRPQFVCHSCGTFKIFPFDKSDDDNSGFASSLKNLKNKTAPSALIEEVRSKSRSFDSSQPILDFGATENIHILDFRYLPDVRPLLPEEGLIFVRSPKGTGKTEMLAKIATTERQAGNKVLLATHRVSLASNLSARTGLDNYKTLKQGTITDHVVICINSLTSRLSEIDEPYDTIIFDESEQVLRALLSKTLRRYLSDVFNKIIWLVQKAKRVICLDADLCSEMTIELILKMRGKTDDIVAGIINNYKIGQGKITHMFPDKFQIVAAAMQSVEDGKKTFIASSTASTATTLAAMVEAMGKRVLLLTANTTETTEAEEFRKNPLKTSQLYDVVVASPSLSTGVSIDGNYFDAVYGIFSAVQGITFQDHDQAIERVRHVDYVGIWIQTPKSKATVQPKEVFIQRAIAKEQKTLKRLPSEAPFTEGQRLWIEVEGLIQYMVATWSVERKLQFVEMRKDLGYEIVDIELNEAVSKEAKEIYNLFKLSDKSRVDDVFYAAIINEDDAMDFAKKRKLTPAEYNSLERFKIEKAIKQPLTYELTEKAIAQNLLQAMWRLKTLYVIDSDSRVRFDEHSREQQPIAFTRASHHTMEHDLLVDKLCQKASINLDDMFERLKNGEEVEITKDTLIEVGKAFDENKTDFNYFFSLRIKDPTDDRSLKKVWDATLGAHLSLPLIKKKLGSKEHRVMKYFIDYSKVDLIHGSIG